MRRDRRIVYSNVVVGGASDSECLLLFEVTPIDGSQVGCQIAAKPLLGVRAVLFDGLDRRGRRSRGQLDRSGR